MPQQLTLDRGCAPPELHYAASCATRAAHHHPWSSHREDAGAAQGACNPFQAGGVWCPALAEHARCAPDYAAGKQTLHLK